MNTFAAGTLPSIHECKPSNEGGTVARLGFNYQDEIAVSLLLDMLELDGITCVQCETHDDVVVVWGGAVEVVEHVQVKANESDSAWSMAGLTRRKDGKAGTSIFELSLSRDAVQEDSRFRIVTLRHVDADLKSLTFRIGKPGREPEKVEKIREQLEKRCPGSESAKGNGAGYWVGNCWWDVRESESAIANDNIVRIYNLSHHSGVTLFPEAALAILRDLRKLAKDAGDAKWEPDREKKIITKSQLQAWWAQRLKQEVERTSTTSGVKLRKKMADADISPSLVRLAVELRRMYAQEARTPKYMEPDVAESLQRRAMSKIASLQSRMDAGDLGSITATQFHDLCLKAMTDISLAAHGAEADAEVFLKGCMYDITDRCLLQFARGNS